MDNENTENETPKNESEETLETPTENETPINDEDTPFVSKEELAELKKKAELAENYKVRAEKAEKKLKEPVKRDEPTLTAKDTVAFINAKVHTDDFDSVLEWAKFKKVSVADALKDDVLKTVLRDKEEKRRTAETTMTKSGRGFGKETPDKIVEMANKGIYPTDEEGIQKLVEAEMELRLRKVRK